jgi:CheY-like chemotaxis protein
MVQGETATVLIVEDEGITRMIVQRMVEALGARAVCVEDGRAALTVSAEQRVDLVLLDCNMPGMDGYEVAAELRHGIGATPPGVPVVALTGDREHATVERCRAAGMDGYLSKPLSLRLLSDTLVRYLAPTMSEQGVVVQP